MNHYKPEVILDELEHCFMQSFFLCPIDAIFKKQELFFSVIKLILAIFLWREIAESCWTRSEQVKNG
jgi:hypothetical protein